MDRLGIARVLLLPVVIEGRDAEQAVVLVRVGVRVRVRVRGRDRVRVRVRVRGDIGRYRGIVHAAEAAALREEVESLRKVEAM